MGQCVLRDCGLDPQQPPSRLEAVLKKHLQDQYFDNIIEKTNNKIPIKDQDFNSSLDFPKKKTILPKKIAKKNWKETYEEEDSIEEKVSEKEAKSHSLATKKIIPLIHKDTEEKDPELMKFQNQNYIKPTTSDLGYEEDLLGGSLALTNERINTNLNTNPNIHINNMNKSKFMDSVKPSDQNQTSNNMSTMFQNQIFDKMNTTPSAVNYRSDDENLGEYEKIFQDDEFMESSDEDYVKKLKNF